jgi:hypothetical protein
MSIAPVTPTKVIHPRFCPTENPVFCCNNCVTTLSARKSFKNYSTALSRGLKNTSSYRPDVEHDIDHTITLIPSAVSDHRSSPRRYFLCEKKSMQYKEVTMEFLSVLEEEKDLVLTFQIWVQCQEHGQEYQLLRFDHKTKEEVVKADVEGLGLKEAELSPRQMSKQKKDILFRKISYGSENRV